jgi:hypothetical protein
MLMVSSKLASLGAFSPISPIPLVEILFDIILRIADRHPLPQSLFKGTRFLAQQRELPGPISMLECVHG